MLRIIRSKSFIAGVFAGFVVFAVVNVLTAYPGYECVSCSGGVMATEEFDAYTEFGWPFRFHIGGTILHLDVILWRGLLADILVAAAISCAAGLLSRSLLAAWIDRPGAEDVN
jgi:hypothetical protein